MSGKEENQLKYVLESLKLQKYYVNFQKEEILYSDLHHFSKADLREFIPSKFHLKRLLVYMNNEKEKKKESVETLSSKSDAETVGKEVENVYDVLLNSTDDELEKIIPKRDHRKRLINFLESTKKEKKKKRKDKSGHQSECEKNEEEGLVQMKIKFGNDVKIFYEIPLGTNEELIGKLVQEFLECELKLPDKTILRKDRKFNLERWLKRAGVSPGNEIRGVLSVKGETKSSISSEDSNERVVELERKLEMVEKERDRKDAELNKLKKEKLTLLEKLKGLESRGGVASPDLEFESGVGVTEEKLKKEKLTLLEQNVKRLENRRGVASPDLEVDNGVGEKEKPAQFGQEVNELESRGGVDSPDQEFGSMVGEKESEDGKQALLVEKEKRSENRVGSADPKFDSGDGEREEKLKKVKQATIGDKEKLKKEKLTLLEQEVKGLESRRGVSSPDLEVDSGVGEEEKRRLELEKRHLEMLETAHNSLWGLNELRVDYFKALELYSEIVNSGGELDANANYNLGFVYLLGYGVKEDNAKFRQYLKKTHEQYLSMKGEELKPVDLKNVGAMYVYGRGFEKNENKGIKMLKTAVERGNSLAMWRLSCLKCGLEGGEEWDSECFKMCSKAAEMGLPVAIGSLGFKYSKGCGVKKDLKKGFALYREAAARGESGAMYNVGVCYSKGMGVERNVVEAKKWLKIASKLGSVEAKTVLERMKRVDMLETAHNCLWGLNGVRIDYYKPHQLYSEIVNSGGNLDANAYFNLGYIYDDGYGVNVDMKQSREFYQKAAEFYLTKNVDDLNQPRDWKNFGKILACLYDDGNEEPKKKGIELLRRAVAGGNSLAMWELGVCYEYGFGAVGESFSESFKFHSMAAEKGLPVAMNNLAIMYSKGLGVKKDEKKAFALWREAAEKGDRMAMNFIGRSYMTGTRVKRNMEESKKWFNKASELGNEDAMKILHAIDSEENDRPKKLEAAHNWLWGLNNVRIDYNKPHQLYKQIVFCNGELDGNAHFNLGEMFWHGSGVKKNKKRSKEYYKKAAEFYSTKKMNDLKPRDWKNMGYMYMLGRGFKENEKKGAKLLKKAVKGGSVLAMRRLGWCYQKGYGVGKSYPESFRLYSKAAEKGLPAAMNNLGIMYQKGFGVKKDRIHAVGLFRKAAEKGHRVGYFNVGRCYLNGLGVEMNEEEAEMWLKVATELGHEDAREILERRYGYKNIL